MPLPQVEELKTWPGHDLQDTDGDKIGTIQDVYVDEQTGRPEWVAVKTGLFGTKVSFVPIADASSDGDTVRVPYSKSQVKDSPNAEADGALSHDEEARLYAHYGLDYSEARSDSGLPEVTRGTYRLFALNAGGEAGPAEQSAVTRPLAPGSPAVALRVREVDVTWTDRSSAESGYQVERRLAGGGSCPSAKTKDTGCRKRAP